MPDCLAKAQKLAESIRFSGDTLRRNTEGDESRTESIKKLFFQSGLLITREITPILYASLDRVCERLFIPKNAVKAFVYASPEIQAECFAAGTTECVLRFTSSLVETLEPNELDYVMGHELGHFLFGHSVARLEVEQESLEYYIQQRAQELSADRMGLIAAGSLDVAVGAIIKTVSGLTSKHLRFDVGTFISQLQKGSFRGHEAATHPSMLIRCRSLLWVSMNESFSAKADFFPEDQVAALDKRVQRDLDKYVDSFTRERIQQAKDDLAIWVAAHEIVQDGIFDRNEQTIFSERFGTETFEKMLNFLREIPSAEIQEVVYERMKALRTELESLIPSSFEVEFSKIKQWSEAYFLGQGKQRNR